MIQIKNDFLTVGFDDMGRIVHMENNKAGYGNIIEYPAAGIFKMVLKKDANWENVVYPAEQSYDVKKDGDKAVITVKGVTVRDGRLDVTVTLRAWLRDDQLCFEADIDNCSDATVVDFMFPRIGVVKSLAGGKPNLLWPQCSGELVTDVGGKLAAMDSPYEEYNMLSTTYPSRASMQWMTLLDGDQSLYFGSHDSEFYASSLRVMGRQDDPGSIVMDIVKYAFVKPGECWHGQPFVLSLATASWRHGADIYRAWADGWFPKTNRSKWIQDMLGYFLIINKQQYGDSMWPYDTLPELWEYAKAHGCDTLGLFGWYAAGHDNQYPYVEPDEAMGGEEGLRENIRKVREDGAHVTLYCQGHLIDVTTDYYKQMGEKVESKSLWGTPYFEQYNKYHESEFLKNFTKKTFSTACPSCPEWHDLMCENARQLHGYGPDGILMDQLGGMPPYPCFDDSHPHEQGKPSLSYTRGRMKLIDRVHDQTQELNPEFGFIIEHVTDVYSSRSDGVHGLTNCRPGSPGVRQALAQGKDVGSTPFAEMYRYTFPEVVITVRNPKPYIRPDMANFALVFGFRYEMELRYLGDVAAIREDRYADWREYAHKVTELRRQYWDVLGRGKFVDEEGIINGNPSVIAKAFTAEGKMAVALWNDTGSDQSVDIRVPGYALVEAATVEGKTDEAPKELAPGQIVILVYRNKI